MKKKFVLTLALVLMVAASLMAATPLEVSGSFKTGYKFAFNPNGVTQVEDDDEASVKTIVDFSGDFWKVSLATEGVMYDTDDEVKAKAEIYLDKALAEQGMDLGDLGLTLHVGSGVGGGALTVLADLGDYTDDDSTNYIDPIEMSTTGNNFGVTLKYADLVEVYASANPTVSSLPMVVGAKLSPVDGVTAAVGFTNDYSGANALTASAKADIAALAGLDFALAATGELFYDVDAKTFAVIADATTTIEGVGLWVAYFNDMANANFLSAKASYETTVEDFTVSASFKADLGDIAASSDESYTIAAGGKYAMGGVTYALDAEYEVVAGTFSLSPSLSIAF